MQRSIAMSIAAAALLSAPARCDFSYEQSSKVTGGALAGMMKVAGAFSKAAREPIKSTVMLKGDRLATVSPKNIEVIDLAKETFTSIDLEDKKYSVITFDDFKRAMEKMAEKMGEQKDANMTFSVAIKDTGNTRNINGIDTKQVRLLMDVQAQDQKSGQTGAMSVASDMFMAPKVPGYDEVTAFYKRMGQRLAWTPGSSMAGMMRPGMMKGMSELSKEAAKLEGVPVLQVTRMGAGSAEALATAQLPPPGEGPAMPSAGEVAGDAAGSAAAGAATSRAGKLGSALGGLGGFGGFGKKKKQEAPPAEAPAQQAPQQSQAQAGVLMEITTEMSGFSSAAVDGSRFEVPTGFKQVPHPFEKELNKK